MVLYSTKSIVLLTQLRTRYPWLLMRIYNKKKINDFRIYRIIYLLNMQYVGMYNKTIISDSAVVSACNYSCDL